MRSQLSSCFLTTVSDDLDGIYSAIRDNALLSKWAGGLGNDWTPVRALGAYIKGTNGKSQAWVPFLKVVNDTAVAVNQCFAPDTRVHTADGVKAISRVTTNDLVLGQRGEYRQVLKTMTYNQTDPMVELRVKHAVQPLRITAGIRSGPFKACLWNSRLPRTVAWLAKGKVEPRWTEAGPALKKGDYVAQAIPREVVPVQGFNEDDARFYGILLGDGHCSKGGLQWGVSGNPTRDVHLRFVAGLPSEQGHPLLDDWPRPLSPSPLVDGSRPRTRRHYWTISERRWQLAWPFPRRSLRRGRQETNSPPFQSSAKGADVVLAARPAGNRRGRRSR